jgi:hypothetical protein
MADEERKLFIDEDWKAKVQREKELARQQAEQKTASPEAGSAAAGAGAGAAASEEAPGQEGGSGEQEDSLFLGLVQSLAAQAMYALGLIAEPGAQQVMVDLGQAKYVVDTLMMLRDKTQGHLTPVEQGQLTEALGELQRLYVLRAQQVQEQTLRKAGVDPHNLGGKQG